MNGLETDGTAMPDMLRKLMLRELRLNGIEHEYLPETGQIMIPIDGHEHPPFITPTGGINYRVEHGDWVRDVLLPVAERVREMAAAWRHSQDMPVGDLPEFRLLAEYNNIVLAARDDTEYGYGLHFVTWEYNYERTVMYRGHYTEDYSYAKEDFALRAGLVPESKVVTREQAAEIIAACEYRVENDWELTLAKDEKLKAISAKLRKAYPAPGNEERAPPGRKPSIGEKLREGKAKSDANRAQNPAPAAKKRTKEID